MMKKLALLGVLMLVAAGTAVAARASGVMQEIIVVPEEKGIPIAVDAKLSAEQMAAAEGIALADSRIQAMLEGADNYRIQVSGVVDVEEFEVRLEDGKLIIPITFEEEKATVEIRIYKEYRTDQELGLKECYVTVDLSEEKVTEIRENPEVRKPKPTILEQEAIGIGREFLENIGCQTGEVLSTDLVHISEVPDGYWYYWHQLVGLETPDMPEPEWCWMVRFEKALWLGHHFEVLVDAHTGKVVGGMQCR